MTLLGSSVPGVGKLRARDSWILRGCVAIGVECLLSLATVCAFVLRRMSTVCLCFLGVRFYLTMPRRVSLPLYHLVPPMAPSHLGRRRRQQDWAVGICSVSSS